MGFLNFQRRQFTTALCLLLFALGVPMVTQVEILSDDHLFDQNPLVREELISSN